MNPAIPTLSGRVRPKRLGCRRGLALPRPTGRARGAFTLIELLTVLGLISTLVAFLLPAIQSAREGARRAHCANNLKQIGLGLLNYHDAWGSFPTQANTRTLGALLPFVEQQPLYNALNQSFIYLSHENLTSSSTLISVYIQPSSWHASADNPAPCDYGMSDEFRDARIADVRDGMQHTLMAAELWPDPRANSWGWSPVLYGVSPESGHHYGRGMNGVFGDGHVRWLPETLPQTLREGYFTRDGGEILCDPGS